MEIFDTYEVNGKVLKIVQDDFVAETPRDWDNLGTMICWHRNYNLGDDHSYSEPRDFLQDLASELPTYHDIEHMKEKAFGNFLIVENEQGLWDVIDQNGNVFDGCYLSEKGAERYYEELKDFFFENLSLDELLEIVQEYAVILPLYLYDHSGITMNTTGFTCRWDSGQVGWIYVSHDDIKKEGISIEQAKKNLIAEVEIYDKYITGDIYGYILEDENGDEIDSCWGFYGHDIKQNGIIDHLPQEFREIV